MNDKMFYENISKQMQEDKEKIKQLEEENKRLKQMVNFGGITITNCPNCEKEITVNFCRETEHYRKKYLDAVADYELEKYKNQKAIEILKLCDSKCARETIEILKGDSNE